jgi:GGDEF domain-containing protein
MLGATFRSADAVARLSGDEFCVLFVAGSDSFESVAELVTSCWASTVDGRNADSPHPYRSGMSLGVATTVAPRELVVSEVIERADGPMGRCTRPRRKRRQA